MRDILFRAKSSNSGEWIEGLPMYSSIKSAKGTMDRLLALEGGYYNIVFIDTETICQYTGLTDKNGRKIFEGDITRLILPNGEIRYFKVSIKSVVRKVLTHPDFDDEFSKVEITGVVFEWQGYELFPCVDTYGHGIQDYKMMEVVGNIFDNQFYEVGQQDHQEHLQIKAGSINASRIEVIEGVETDK